MDNATGTAIQKAHEFLKAGNRQEARAILIPIVQADQDVAEAWYLLGFAVTDPEKRMYTFKQVLRIDPSNQAAKKQIEKLLGTQPSAAAVEETPAAPEKHTKQRRTSFVLVWGLASMAALLFCMIAVGGWWLSRNGLPVFEAPSPTSFSRHPISTPTVTPYPSVTHRLTLTPSLTLIASLTITPTARVNLTSNATPNLAAFAIVLSPIPEATLDVSKLTVAESQKIDEWEGSGHAANTELKSNRLAAGESVSIPLNIDTAGETVFNLQWLGKDGLGKDAPIFTLMSPDHQLIDQEYATKHPSEASYQAIPGLLFFSVFFDVKKAQAGEWQLNLAASEPGAYILSGTLTSDMTLHAVGDKFSYTAGNVASFVALLKNKDGGSTGATLTAVINLPDQSTETLSLKDYGDGIYAATYNIPDVPGFGMAQVTAKGNNNGTNFARQSNFQFTIFPGGITLSGEYSDKLAVHQGHTSLDVSVGVDSDRARKVGLSGFLKNMSASNDVVSTADVSLVPGHNIVTISFFGSDFQFWRLDGPYWLSLDFVDFDTGVYTEEVSNVWQTAAYHWRDFGAAACFSLTTGVRPDPSMGSISVSPKPNCPNGEYMEGTEITLQAIAKPEFQFTGWAGDVGTQDSFTATTTIRIGRDYVANAYFEKKP